MASKAAPSCSPSQIPTLIHILFFEERRNPSGVCTQDFPATSWAADPLENRLHTLVCSGQLELKTAQQAIGPNWIEAYKKYVGPQPKPLGRPSEDERAETAPEVAPAAPGSSLNQHEEREILAAWLTLSRQDAPRKIHELFRQ